MKFSAVAAATTSLILLPLGVLASPVPEPAPVALSEGIEARGEAPAPISIEDHEGRSDAGLETRDIFARAKAWCKVVNVDDHANCRSGPGTNYPTKFWAVKNVNYAFACYKKGTCVDGNW